MSIIYFNNNNIEYCIEELNINNTIVNNINTNRQKTI